MGEEITYQINDTTRAIEGVIKNVKDWQAAGGSANPREAALVITKLDEARLWSLLMFKQLS